MTISPHALTLAAAAVLIALMMYRRFRRNFGRQPVRPARMMTRAVVLAVVGALMLFASLHDPMALAAGAGGVVVGVALGWWGLRLTRFEHKPDGVHYIPHSWFGAVISVLLVGRIAYRFVVLGPMMQGIAMGPMAMYQRNPITLALFGLLVGYYVCYYLGVLQIARRTPAEVAAD